MEVKLMFPCVYRGPLVYLLVGYPHCHGTVFTLSITILSFAIIWDLVFLIAGSYLLSFYGWKKWNDMCRKPAKLQPRNGLH